MKILCSVIAVGMLFCALHGQAAVIVDPSVYSATASSEFAGGFEVENLFDNTVAEWAILGAANPQGRYEGWIAVTLDGVYDIDAIRFAPRAASGVLDGTETMNVWVGQSSFGVNVQNAGETAAFWAGNQGSIDLTVNNFADAAVHDYALDGGTTRGTYLLARFTGWVDPGTIGNLGGSYFLIDGDQVVPEPATLGFAAISFGVLFAVRKKMRMHYG
jgi:hypothetical protein